MKPYSQNLILLISIGLLCFPTLNVQSAELPLRGNNVNDVREDIPGYPLSFRLIDKSGKARFQVLMKGQAIVSAATGVDTQASSSILIASIQKNEWQLQTYKQHSKLSLRFLPVKLDSGTALRVWTEKDKFFDIDLDFTGELEYEDIDLPGQDTPD